MNIQMGKGGFFCQLKNIKAAPQLWIEGVKCVSSSGPGLCQRVECVSGEAQCKCFTALKIWANGLSW